MKNNAAHPVLSWVVVVTAATFLLFQFVIQSSTSTMINDLMHEFDIDINQMALLSSSFYWSYVFCQIPAGIMIDKIGPRKTLIISISLSTISAFIFASAPNSIVAEVTRFAMGVFCAPALAASVYLCARWFPKEQFPLMVGLVESIGLVGGAIGSAFMAMGVSYLGWRTSYALCGVSATVLLVLTWVTVQDLPKSEKLLKNVFHDKSQKTLKSFKALLKNTQVWLVAIYGGFLFALLNGFAGMWAIPFTMNVHGLSNQDAVNISALTFSGAAVGAPLVGLFVKKLGRCGPPLFILPILCIIIFSIFVYIPSASFTLLAILSFSLGFFCTAYMLPFTIIKLIAPIETQGAAMGFTNMMSISFGAIIMQPLTAYIIDVLHSGPTHITDLSVISAYEYRVALSPFLGCLLLAFVLAFFVKDSQK